MNYIYCWYHHMIPEQERKEISETIRNKNYEKFLYLYQQYAISSILEGHFNEEFQTWFPMVYLPNEINVVNNKDEIINTLNILCKDDFMKITHEECECG